MGTFFLFAAELLQYLLLWRMAVVVVLQTDGRRKTTWINTQGKRRRNTSIFVPSGQLANVCSAGLDERYSCKTIKIQASRTDKMAHQNQPAVNLSVWKERNPSSATFLWLFIISGNRKYIFWNMGCIF